eukprot:CAMPEP_0170236966 /NCGR_PEP_ID=MMETSP0116_2-20130129/18232_1 /TAXON_ID=400756 /ORGANISM="Durinskia baltica, Strain CSIRO CS-38" /LENGTH=553 /DNA_ID=CAMNT_0010487767 /DNA_START=98 /DNA_END=1757 /DNA_ORIENTATION=-
MAAPEATKATAVCAGTGKKVAAATGKGDTDCAEGASGCVDAPTVKKIKTWRRSRSDRLALEANRAQEEGDMGRAMRANVDAAEVLLGLSPSPCERSDTRFRLEADVWDMQNAARLLADAATAGHAGGDVFGAITLCERGFQILERAAALSKGDGLDLHSREALLFASSRALMEIGLYDLASERLDELARLAYQTLDPRSFDRVALSGLQRKLRTQRQKLENGDAEALMEEISVMGQNLDDKEAGYWISCVGELSRTKEGRRELVAKGFLAKKDENLFNHVSVARRAAHLALRYRVNLRLQKALSEAGLVRGLGDPCVAPRSLANDASSHLMPEAACRELARNRLAVVDGVFSAATMARLRGELCDLRRARFLRSDSSDVCNPAQEARYLPIALAPEDIDPLGAKLRASCPATMEVVQSLCGLPFVLEECLGLELAVPTSVMAACYPPTASYKMHLDSYALQGVESDVPRKVTILLYCNPEWSSGDGGVLRVWAPFDPGKGPHRDIEPRAGRLVVFMSEEVWHEVTESRSERYALTLWAMTARELSSVIDGRGP